MRSTQLLCVLQTTIWRLLSSTCFPYTTLFRSALLLTVIFSIIGTLQLFAEPRLMQTMSAGITSEYTPNMSAYAFAFQYNDIGMAAAQAVIIAISAFILSAVALGVSTGTGRRR